MLKLHCVTLVLIGDAMNCNECGVDREEWETELCEGCGMKKQQKIVMVEDVEKQFAQIGKSLARCDARGLPEEVSSLIREARRLHGWSKREIDA